MQDTQTGKPLPTVEELERALEEALLARRLKRPVCPTYWVRAVLQTKLGHVTAKVAFLPPALCEVKLVLPWEPGWNFSSREYAEELAVRAAGALEDQLIGTQIALHTEVVQED